MASNTEVEVGELVSRQEAARLAGVHVNTIRLWEDHGRLHSIKQENGRVMIRLSELEGIVKERQPTGDPEARIAELEAEAHALREANALYREMLAQLRSEHSELLATIRSLAGGKE